MAEAFAFVGSRYLDLVIDKVRNLFSCEIIAKKEKGGLGNSLMG